MRLCSIASGSSGNCIYVGSETAHLLVDVGISGKKIEKGLGELGLRNGRHHKGYKGLRRAWKNEWGTVPDHTGGQEVYH